MSAVKEDRSAKQHETDIAGTIARVRSEQAIEALTQMAALAGVQLPSFCHGPGGVPTQSDVDALIAAKRKRERRRARNRVNWRLCDCGVCEWDRSERARRRDEA